MTLIVTQSPQITHIFIFSVKASFQVLKLKN